jgi:hypothetical protein
VVSRCVVVSARDDALAVENLRAGVSPV